ncbi:MAG TPA: tetratricopeptide repeat protein [Candidatus Acidoferrum sp.]|nr:tetratricopeptide repeat protein [Candidatus Acidoferrum sp.]
MDRTNKARDALRVGLLLAALTLVAYWPMWQNGFVSYDDRSYVTENPHVLGGLSLNSIKWALTTGHAGNWHPLTWLSHILDAQIYGLWAAGHHATNLLLHIANTLLLFAWLRRVTGALWRSALVAALFAVHPLHVESVAWVAERKDVLSMFFFMLTLWTYTRWVEEGEHPTSNTAVRGACSVSTQHATRNTFHAPRFALYVLSLLSFALGLMSKPMLVTVPFVLVLLDYWPLGRFAGLESKVSSLESKEDLARNTQYAPRFSLEPLALSLWDKLPFFALSLASSAATFLIQRNAGAVSSLDTLPLEFRISNAFVSCLRYAAKLFWPVRLAAFYPAPSHWPDAWVAGAIVFLVGVTALVVWRAPRAPYLPVGWFWYLGTLVPVIGIVQVGQQSMADRYSYIPLIGLFIMLVWGAAAVCSRWPAARGALAACGVAAVCACAVLTWRQVEYWHDSASLFQHALAVTEDNAVAQNNLGACSLDAGNLAEAEAHFAEAVRIHPNYPEALANLGLCRQQAGQEQEAIDLLLKSVRVQSSPAVEYNLGELLSRRGELAPAESHYRTALKENPEFAEAWCGLGQLKARQGQVAEAVQCYTTALRFKPGLVAAHEALGGMLEAQKKLDQAIPHFEAAVRSAPTDPNAHYNLAAALNAKGDFAGAAAQYAETCRLRPDDLEARRNLALALLGQGKLAEAASQLEQVLRVRPDAATEHYLALALDSQGQTAAALPHYREAVRLAPDTALYLNDLAWILATSPQAELRNGAEAVQLAETACKLSGGKEARCYGTLDAAYAEVGRFDDAVATATKARDLALAAGQKELAGAAEARLALYQQRKPFRQPVVTAPPP